MKFREFIIILKKSFKNSFIKVKKDKGIHTVLGIDYTIKKIRKEKK